MLETLQQIYKINATSSINGFLYFLKKFPLLGKLFKTTSYTFPRLKRALGVVSLLYKILSTLVGTLIFFQFLLLPSIFIAGEQASRSLATLILFVYYILRLLTSEVLQYEMNKFIMVRQMRMDARNYALASTIPNETLKFLAKALLLSLLLPFGSTTYAVLLAMSISSFAIFSEALHLYLYQRFGFNLAKKSMFSLTLTVVTLLTGYALAFIFPLPLFQRILTSPLFLAVTILSGIPGALYLFRYEGYSQAIADTNNLESLADMRKTMSEARVKDIRIKEKDFRESDLRTSRESSKEGYRYLNDIFFRRHRKMVYRPMLIKSALIIALFLALIIAGEFFTPAAGEISTLFYDQFTLFVFAMYLLCNSQQVTRSMFYNCDLSLLRYGFYKKGDALLRMFTLRLLSITGYNLVPTTFLAAGVTCTTLRFTAHTFTDILPVILLLYALALFFSVHYLFMYYIFQPFTSSMQMKNPFYGLINFAVYFISYIIIQFPAPPALFLPIITGLLVLYTTIALFLVYRKAPQTFRIK